ncbi:MAG: transcriptional regulator [Halobacteriota archaeon]|nr:transcriptional regulator [Halobacteriota archaeon]
MKFPCEIVIWYVLPTIRAELAKELVNLELSQKSASKKLGITQAAVSQYLGNKRGKDVDLGDEIKEMIRNLAKDLINGEDDKLTTGVCAICSELKKDKKICELYREHNVTPDKCDACLK